MSERFRANWSAVYIEAKEGDIKYCDAYSNASAQRIAAALNAQAVWALEVFRIAGGDTECRPNPTADEALEVLRDLRQCYDEALNAQAGVVEDEATVERVWRAIRNAMNRNGGKPVTNDQWRALALAALAAVKGPLPEPPEETP